MCILMSPPGQTGNLSIHFVCYAICEQDISKTDKPILMSTGKSGPWGKGMKRSNLRVWSRSHKAKDRSRGFSLDSFKSSRYSSPPR